MAFCLRVFYNAYKDAYKDYVWGQVWFAFIQVSCFFVHIIHQKHFLQLKCLEDGQTVGHFEHLGEGPGDQGGWWWALELLNPMAQSPGSVAIFWRSGSSSSFLHAYLYIMQCLSIFWITCDTCIFTHNIYYHIKWCNVFSDHHGRTGLAAIMISEAIPQSALHGRWRTRDFHLTEAAVGKEAIRAGKCL